MTCIHHHHRFCAIDASDWPLLSQRFLVCAYCPAFFYMETNEVLENRAVGIWNMTRPLVEVRG